MSSRDQQIILSTLYLFNQSLKRCRNDAIRRVSARRVLFSFLNLDISPPIQIRIQFVIITFDEPIVCSLRENFIRFNGTRILPCVSKLSVVKVVQNSPFIPHSISMPADLECKQYLGLSPYGKISASTSWPYRRRASCQPEDGYIMSHKGWCSRKRYSQFLLPWMIRNRFRPINLLFRTWSMVGIRLGTSIDSHLIDHQRSWRYRSRSMGDQIQSFLLQWHAFMAVL